MCHDMGVEIRGQLYGVSSRLPGGFWEPLSSLDNRCIYLLSHLVGSFFEIYLLYMYWCFAYMHVCVRMPHPLELEL